MNESYEAALQALPESYRRSLIVSIHDVSPHTWGECQEIIAKLHTIGVDRTSLLVIPDHHHKGHFLESAPFCNWLQNEDENGHEVVIHGYHHLDEGPKRETVIDQLTTQFYTAGEAEFYSISHEQAIKLVRKARGEFSKIGIQPVGFIAPAWLLGTDAEDALRDLRISYTTRLKKIFDLQKNITYPTQSLCWSVRAGWRRAMSLFWNKSLYHRLQSAPVMRLAIHPVDLRHPAIWRQIESMITAAIEYRTVFTYRAWLELMRDSTQPFPGNDGK